MTLENTDLPVPAWKVLSAFMLEFADRVNEGGVDQDTVEEDVNIHHLDERPSEDVVMKVSDVVGYIDGEKNDILNGLEELIRGVGLQVVGEQKGKKPEEMELEDVEVRLSLQVINDMYEEYSN